MEAALEQIREQQKETWNKFSAGWKKHDEFTMNFLKPMGDAIIRALQLKDTDSVLDIATGTGEPGLTIASIVKKGKVVGTDLSDDMLAIARDNAAKKGLSNYSTKASDVCELPFADNSFDAISCRFGFMFFPYMLVLKPGGKIATSVWGGPDKNAWVTATMSVINKNIEMPAPPPGSPGMFRCAQPGFIADLFKQAWLSNITEENVEGKVNYGTNEFYWKITTEMAAPVAAVIAKADDQLKEKIRKEVFGGIDANYPGANIPYGAIIISGRK